MFDSILMNFICFILTKAPFTNIGIAYPWLSTVFGLLFFIWVVGSWSIWIFSGSLKVHIRFWWSLFTSTSSQDPGWRGKGSNGFSQYKGCSLAHIRWIPSLLQTMLDLSSVRVSMTQPATMWFLGKISWWITMPAGSSSVSEELSDRKREGRTDQNTITSHKRKREYLWKRERKCRQLVVRGTNSSISCRRNSDNTEILSPELQSGICTSSSQIDKSVSNS